MNRLVKLSIPNILVTMLLKGLNVVTWTISKSIYCPLCRTRLRCARGRTSSSRSSSRCVTSTPSCRRDVSSDRRAGTGSTRTTWATWPSASTCSTTTWRPTPRCRGRTSVTCSARSCTADTLPTTGTEGCAEPTSRSTCIRTWWVSCLCNFFVQMLIRSYNSFGGFCATIG